MFKTGQILLVVAVAAVAAGGAAGFVDAPITLTADNGAEVTQIDETSWNVTLAAGTTLIVGNTTADGVEITGSVVEEAGDPATVIDLTVTAAG
jgi:hypothetical protein